MLMPYKNETQNDVHIGGKRIPPGATRMVDTSLIDGGQPVNDLEYIEPPPLQALRKKTVTEIKAALAALSDVEITELSRLEQAADKPRHGLLLALDEELLRRAAQ